MTKRERLYPEIRRLREREELTWREIGERLGISYKTANAYYHDPTGERERARKARNDGRCLGCGARTNSSGSSVPPERCHRCAPTYRRALGRRWILESMREWCEMFGYPPVAADWNPAHARARSSSAWRADRMEATGRPWPGPDSVIDHFGSWNAGIAAAGFQPLRPSERRLGRVGVELRREVEATA